MSSFSSAGRLAINTTADAGGRALYVVQPNGGYGSVFEGVGTVPNVSIYAAAGGVGLIVAAAASQTADLTQWQNSAGTVLASVIAGGSIRGFAGLYGANSANSSVNPLFVVNSVAANVVAIIKGAASQSADLQQWQNSAGTVLAKFDSNGNFQNSIQTSTTLYTQSVNSGSLSFAGVAYNGFSNPSGVTTLPTLVVKGVASQTANLQEWQNSAGTVLSSINSGGNLILGNQYISNSGASGYGRLQLLDGGTNQTVFYPASAGLLIANAGVVGMAVVKVRGASGQTANLQEWQDSTGAVLSKIDYRGWLILPSANRFVLGGGIGDFAETGAYLLTGSSNITIGTRSASNKGLVVQGAASQTANLQEWQNSSGTVLAKVDAYGYVTSYGAVLPSGNGSFESAYGGAFMGMKKTTSAVANPGADLARIYLVAGTNAGTLKLVVRAGASGAETTILDNIPQ